jgi:hypothetical protein
MRSTILLVAAVASISPPKQGITVIVQLSEPPVVSFDVQRSGATCGSSSEGRLIGIRVEHLPDERTVWEARGETMIERLEDPIVYGVAPTAWHTQVEPEPLLPGERYRVETEGGGFASWADASLEFTGPSR